MSNSTDFRTRAVMPPDAAIAAASMSKELPLPARLKPSLEPLLSLLFQQEQLIGGCIEERPLNGGDWHIVGIGFSGFVADRLIDEFLAAPTPFFAVVLLDRARRGDPGVFLTPQQVARASTKDGLNLVVLYYTQKYKDPNDPRTRRLLPYGHRVFLRVHGGYRLRRLLQEDFGEFESVYVSAGYRVVRRFPAGTSCPLGIAPLAASRSLVGLTAEQARRALPGTTVSFLFEYQEPKLGLTAAERRLISLAMDGRTDAEIAKLLALSPNTLKQTWRQIYTRTETYVPYALGGPVEAGNGGGRGTEKRRRLLSYLQEHLEEIRPG